MGADDDGEDIPATQPVLPFLLEDVVAYVEVRSGHDNRSRGVKSQLKNLGATVVDNLTNHVTHVIFNEGLPSTYKKAKKFNCHLVSVLWIEACKQEITKVSEAGYPPIGHEIYENPRSLKNFKKLKSMQPDFDEEENEKKTNQVLKCIKRRKAKPETKKKTSLEAANIMLPPRTLAVDKSPQKKTFRKSARGKVKSKEDPKEDALKEITPDIINKPIVPSNVENSLTSGASMNAQDSNITGTTNNVPLSQSSTSSSSSVIFCGQVEEAGSTMNRQKKTSKCVADAPISRFDFLESLNDIMSNLSQEKKSKAVETSPWRRKPNALTQNKSNNCFASKQGSPRRSPRNKVTTSNIVASPRRSPRHTKGQRNANKKSKEFPGASGCSTASAAIRQRHKFPLPTSPTDSFVLLSQEPGDMPSVDEMVKMKRGSIHVGNERITLSQIVRSYNAVANRPDNGSGRNSGVSCEEVEESCDILNEGEERNNKHLHQETNLEDEDDVCPSELSKDFGSFCHSDSGSTVSSSGGNVWIDGIPQDMKNKKPNSSVLLPNSEGIDVENISQNFREQSTSTLEESATVDNIERHPSPVFMINKARYRRPMKKKLPGAMQQAVVDSFSSTKKEDASASSYMVCGQSMLPSEQSRECLSPVAYINKLVPKFSVSISRTPMNMENCDVIVEDTPDVPSSSKCEISSVVIPPTPLENEAECERSEDTDSLNKSLNKSVIPLLKKGCKVPLFASRLSKTPQTRISDKALADPNSKGINVRNIANIASAFSQEGFPQDVADNLKSCDGITTNSSLKPGNPLAVPTSAGCDEVSTKSNLGDLKSHSSPESENKTAPNEESVQRGAFTDRISQCSSARKSPRNQQPMMPSNEVYQESIQETACNGNVKKECSSSKLMKEKKETSSTKKSKRSRGRVIAVVMVDDSVGNKKTETASLGSSPLCSEFPMCPQRVLSSSGYETSQSEDNSGGKKGRKKTVIPEGKRLMPNSFSSPASSAPKKRSEIYEGDGNTSSPAEDERDIKEARTSAQPQRKRNQSPAKSESNKKQKLDDSETESCLSGKTARVSRANSRSLQVSRSCSDLSVERTKLSMRKSSQEAKKRLAKSATRNHLRCSPKVIVCTFLTASEQNGIEAAGENLDNWKLEEKVTSRTTHVINSGPKRTINMLKGMVRGCWLVEHKWMLDSSKKGTWLDEEKYELVTFSPALRQCRLRRQALGMEYKHTLFAQAGPIYVSPKTEGPPAKDLRELLELCGADVRTSSHDAKIVIGCKLSEKGTFQCVQARWVLDSITKNKILSLKNGAYKIK